MKTNYCKFDGCVRPARRRGLCSRHGIQQKQGVPLTPLPKVSKGSEPLAERMAWRTRRTASCWEWTGAIHSGGYGQIRHEGKVLYAHRVAWELHHGPIPAEQFIDHMCRNRLCVNPAHLQVTTRKQNNENLGIGKNNKSGVRGVHWNKARRKWTAAVTHNYSTFSAGNYESLADAERAVIELRNRMHTNNLSDRSSHGGFSGSSD